MQYNYLENAGDTTITIKDDTFRHLYKSRREDKNKNQFFRNLKDSYIYEYKVLTLDKKSATLSLVDKTEVAKKSIRYLHIGWAIIDTKTIEKTLPFLNELGVSKITFFYSQRSQKNFRIDIDRLNRILINSSMQCGRDDIIELETLKTLDDYIKMYPNSYMLNFSENKTIDNSLESIIIGPEGGFSDEEVALFDKKIIGLNCPHILKSETATVSISSKVLS
jgi:16S rRNA (uracil1498-N3)-methyltransferase